MHIQHAHTLTHIHTHKHAGGAFLGAAEHIYAHGGKGVLV